MAGYRQSQGQDSWGGHAVPPLPWQRGATEGGEREATAPARQPLPFYEHSQDFFFLYVVGGFQQLEREEEKATAKQTAPALRLCHLQAAAAWGGVGQRGEVWGGVGRRGAAWGAAPASSSGLGLSGSPLLQQNQLEVGAGLRGSLEVWGGEGERAPGLRAPELGRTEAALGARGREGGEFGESLRSFPPRQRLGESSKGESLGPRVPRVLPARPLSAASLPAQPTAPGARRAAGRLPSLLRP